MAKKRAKTTKKKTAKKTARKVAKKKATKKAARKPAKKVARKAAPAKLSLKRAAQPKKPRRTKQAAPPETRGAPPPVVDVTPVAPPPPPPLVTPPPMPPTGTDIAAAPEAPPSEENDISGSPDVGDPAPEFSLSDDAGHVHTLSQYRGKAVVLYFYPKDDTPGCTAEACGFRDRLGDFADHNAVVLGVSPDSAQSHERFAQKYGLTFPLLADEGHQVAARYGVWVQKNRYGRTYMGVARTTFVIDADGRVAHVFHNVHPDGHEREVLGRL